MAMKSNQPFTAGKTLSCRRFDGLASNIRKFMEFYHFCYYN